MEENKQLKDCCLKIHLKSKRKFNGQYKNYKVTKKIC